VALVVVWLSNYIIYNIVIEYFPQVKVTLCNLGQTLKFKIKYETIKVKF